MKFLLILHSLIRNIWNNHIHHIFYHEWICNLNECYATWVTKIYHFWILTTKHKFFNIFLNLWNIGNRNKSIWGLNSTFGILMIKFLRSYVNFPSCCHSTSSVYFVVVSWIKELMNLKTNNQSTSHIKCGI